MSQWARPAPLLDSIHAAWVGGQLHGETHMATVPKIDWNAVIADPRFQVLHRKKQGFLAGLMIFSVVFYFCCRSVPRTSRTCSRSRSGAS